MTSESWHMLARICTRGGSCGPEQDWRLWEWLTASSRGSLYKCGVEAPALYREARHRSRY
jgi:hypothetical protein